MKKLTIFEELIKKNILFDSHVHLNTDQYKEKMLKGIVRRALEKKVIKIIDMSVNLESAVKSLEIAEKFKGTIYSAVGIDPEVYIPGSELFNENFDVDISMDFLEQLVEGNKQYVAMIGETGIDNHWIHQNDELTEDDRDEIIANQTHLFERHIELSVKHDLPLSIHSRGAVELCIDVISDFPEAKGVFHSLTNDPSIHSGKAQEDEFYNQVKKIIEMGPRIGVNGIVTYKSAALIKNVYLKILKEQCEKSGISNKVIENLENNTFLKIFYKAGFVIETDGPYLIPAGFSTIHPKINEPAAVGLILEFLKKELISSVKG